MTSTKYLRRVLAHSPVDDKEFGALLDVAEAARAYRVAVKRAAPYETVTWLAADLDEALRQFDWGEDD